MVTAPGFGMVLSISLHLGFLSTSYFTFLNYALMEGEVWCTEEGLVGASRNGCNTDSNILGSYYTYKHSISSNNDYLQCSLVSAVLNY